jgi:hypothetical protein
MAKKTPRYMSNTATEGVDRDGYRYTDREVSDKPFPGQGSEYFGKEVDEAVGAGRGRVNPPMVKPRRSAAVEQAIQEMQDAKDRKKVEAMGFKKGGSVGSASKRADGCATRGKTRGKMV